MNLPETWQLVRLETVCRINPRNDLSEKISDDTDVSFVPMVAVDEKNGAIVKSELRRYEAVSRGFTPFRDGDVLFAKITPCMENGKAAMASGLHNGIGFGSTEFHVLRPSEHLLATYLLQFIRQPRFRAHAAAAFIGSAGQQRVPADFLARVPIPLPPFEEQQHIVDILRQTDELRQVREEAQQQARQLTGKLFLSMFGDPNPRRNRRWPIAKLGEMVDVETGGTPSRHASGLYGGDINWVKSTELTDREVAGTEEKITEAGLASSNVKLFPPGTILLAMYGQGQTRGRTAKLMELATCNQACAAIRPSKGILPDYLWFWLQNSYEDIRALGRGGQQANLNLSIVRSLMLPIPPLLQQEKFAALVAEIGKSQDAIRSNMRDHEWLSSSLASSAFRGKLTETWRAHHRRELEAAARERDQKLAGKARITFSEQAPAERHLSTLQDRNWLKNQLSEVQQFVWEALLKSWRGTLIPSEEGSLAEFRRQCFEIEHLENADDRILRALGQLAGLGLIAKISLPNEEGEYVTGYRPLRDEERSRGDDIAILSAPRS